MSAAPIQLMPTRAGYLPLMTEAPSGSRPGNWQGIGEPQALSRQAIEIRRLVEGRPVTTEVHPAEVVDEEEDDVGHGKLSVAWTIPRKPSPMFNFEPQQGFCRSPGSSRRRHLGIPKTNEPCRGSLVASKN